MPYQSLLEVSKQLMHIAHTESPLQTTRAVCKGIGGTNGWLACTPKSPECRVSANAPPSREIPAPPSCAPLMRGPVDRPLVLSGSTHSRSHRHSEARGS